MEAEITRVTVLQTRFTKKSQSIQWNPVPLASQTNHNYNALSSTTWRKVVRDIKNRSEQRPKATVSGKNTLHVGTAKKKKCAIRYFRKPGQPKHGLGNGLTTETCTTNSDDVSVWGHVELTVGTFRNRVELWHEIKTMVGPDPTYPPKRSASARNENKRDPFICTENNLSLVAQLLWSSSWMDNFVGFTVIHSLISWNMVVPLGNDTEMYEFTRMSTSPFMMLRKAMSCAPQALVNEIGWKNKQPCNRNLRCRTEKHVLIWEL